MTKKFIEHSVYFLTALIIVSRSDVRSNPGRVYMH